MATRRFLGRIRPSAAKLATLAMFAAAPALAQLPEPPRQINHAGPNGEVYQGTAGNTTAGDCTLAGMWHLRQGWSACAGKPIATVTDAQALADYSVMTGYDPATGQPDTGCVETDVLDHWQRDGFDGDRINGYAAVNTQNLLHIRQAIWVFGGIYLGLELPESAEQQTNAGQPWSVPWFSRDLGGHCVVAAEYDDTFLYVSTWATRQPVYWDFVLRYFDAAYAIASPDWIAADGQAPNGLDLAALLGDLPYVAN